jgi:hypothetical protein
MIVSERWAGEMADKARPILRRLNAELPINHA